MERKGEVFILSRRQTEESNEMFLVFVYGTLMQGFSNHRLLEAGRAQYLGRAATRSRYTLVDLGHFPGMLEGGNTSVRGEVFEVDAQTLAKLDRLEGHPRFYRRKPVSLAQRPPELRREHPQAEIWAYLLPAEEYGQRPEIPSGDWRARGHLPDERTGDK